MIKRLKKLKQLWKLSNQTEFKELEAELIPGKAIFLSDFDEEERNDHIKKVEEGWGAVLEKFKKLL